jgi:hypothetical protein
MRLAPLALLPVLVLGACKGGDSLPPAKMDTARSTADSVAAAFKAKSAAGLDALLPTAEQLAKVVDCDTAAVVQKLKDKVEQDLKDVPDGTTVEIGVFDKFGTEDRQLKVGDDWDGCKVKTPFTIHRSKVELHLLHDNKTDFKDVLMPFAQLPDDPKFYYLR